MSQYFENYLGTTESTVMGTTAQPKYYLAQTFTPGTTGPNLNHLITGIEISLTKTGSPTGNLLIEIREMDGTQPNGSVIGTGLIALSGVTTKNWYAATSVSSCNVIAGTTYGLVVYPDVGMSDSAYTVWNSDNTGYSGGSSWSSTDNGASFTTGSLDGDDFAFRLTGGFYGGTLCSYNDVILKAGIGANATAIAIANISNYVRNAEAVVCATSGYNWIENWEDCDANLKRIVSEYVSSLAAKKVVDYDVIGYDSRFEAQYISDSLTNDLNTYAQILSDANTKKFIQTGTF